MAFSPQVVPDPAEVGLLFETFDAQCGDEVLYLKHFFSESRLSMSVAFVNARKRQSSCFLHR